MRNYHIFLMRGGLYGWDGIATSYGIDQLSSLLRKSTPTNVTASVWNWSNADAMLQQLQSLAPEVEVILIGYSGGGWKIEEVAIRRRPHPIKLLIGMDPSPSWKVNRLQMPSNVERAICYWNDHPNLGNLGGGLYIGAHIEMRRISMNHLSVQYDLSLRGRILKDVQSAIL